MSAIPGGIPFAGLVAPTDSTDTYAVTDETYNRGGYRSVASIAARDAITADRRLVGMLVNVSGGQIYQLQNGITNSDWVVFSIASGSDVAAISAYLDGRITNVENTYTPRSETARVSAYLQSEIDALSAALAGVTPNHNSLIGLQGGITGQYYHLSYDQFSDYIGASDVARISAYLDNRITNIDVSSQIVGISSYLQSQITDNYSILVAVSSNLQTQIDNLDLNYATDAQLAAASGYLLTQIVSLSANLQTQITQNTTDIASLSAQIGSFNQSHNSLLNIQGGISGQYYHLSQSQHDDYIGKTTVVGISSYLQSEIIDIYSQITDLSGFATARSYQDGTFTNSDLVAGTLSVTHNLNSLIPDVIIYDNTENWIVPDEITVINSNTLDISFENYIPISGTWYYSIRKSGYGSGTVGVSGGSGGHTIQYNGVSLPQRTKLNFTGSGIYVTDDAGNDATIVNIISGGGTGDITRAEVAGISAYLNTRIDNIVVTGDITKAEVAGISAYLQSQIDSTNSNLESISAYLQSQIDDANSSILAVSSNIPNDIRTYLGQLDVSIIPSTSGTLDLGSSDKPFRDLYLTGNSLHLGNKTFSISNDGVVIGADPIILNSYLTENYFTKAESSLIDVFEVVGNQIQPKESLADKKFKIGSYSSIISGQAVYNPGINLISSGNYWSNSLVVGGVKPNTFVSSTAASPPPASGTVALTLDGLFDIHGCGYFTATGNNAYFQYDFDATYTIGAMNFYSHEDGDYSVKEMKVEAYYNSQWNLVLSPYDPDFPHLNWSSDVVLNVACSKIKVTVTKGGESGTTGRWFLYEVRFKEGSYATTSNTIDTGDLVTSGTASFAPALINIYDENNSAIENYSAVNVAYRTVIDGTPVDYGAPISLSSFKSLSPSLFQNCSELKIRLQPVDDQKINGKLDIETTSTSITLDPAGSINGAVNGVDIYSATTDGFTANKLTTVNGLMLNEGETSYIKDISGNIIFKDQYVSEISLNTIVSTLEDISANIPNDIRTYLGQLDVSIVPLISGAVDLGSATKPFRDLYLTGNSLHLGSNTISVSGNDIVIGSDPIILNSYLTTNFYNKSESSLLDEFEVIEIDGIPTIVPKETYGNNPFRLGTSVSVFSVSGANFVNNGANITYISGGGYWENLPATFPFNNNDYSPVSGSTGGPYTIGILNYTVSASSEYDGTYAIYKAFDGIWSGNNGWASLGSAPQWLTVDFGENIQKIIVKYAFSTMNNSSYCPKTWTFEGSNDNSSWDILDTRTNQSNVHSTIYEYTFANFTKYRYYKINVSVTNGGGIVGLLELGLYESSSSSNTIDTTNLVPTGTLNFAPSTLKVYDETGARILTVDGSAYKIAFQKTIDVVQTVFATPENPSTFLARASSEFADCSELKLRIQPQGSQKISRVVINNASSSITLNPSSAMIGSADGQEIWKAEATGKFSAKTFSTTNGILFNVSGTSYIKEVSGVLVVKDDSISETSFNEIITTLETISANIPDNIRSYLGQLDVSIVPSTSGNLDLGSSSKPFRDLYLLGNSIHLGAKTISVSGNDIVIGSDPIILNSYLTTNFYNKSESSLLDEFEVVDIDGTPTIAPKEIYGSNPMRVGTSVTLYSTSGSNFVNNGVNVTYVSGGGYWQNLTFTSATAISETNPNTDTNTPYVVYSPSELNETYAAWKAFDGVVGSGGWSTLSGQSYLRIYFATGKIIAAYKLYIYPSGVSYSPQDWTFEGSINGSSWDILDTKTSQSTYDPATDKIEFSNTTAYNYYRLNVSHSRGGDSYTGTRELYLYVSEAATTNNAFDTPNYVTSGTLSFAASTMKVYDESGSQIFATDGSAYKVAFQKTIDSVQTVFSTPENPSVFLARPSSQFAECSEFRLRIQPVGMQKISKVTISTSSSSITLSPTSVMTGEVNSQEVWKADSSGNFASNTFTSKEGSLLLDVSGGSYVKQLSGGLSLKDTFANQVTLTQLVALPSFGNETYTRDENGNVTQISSLLLTGQTKLEEFTRSNGLVTSIRTRVVGTSIDITQTIVRDGNGNVVAISGA